jgi:hypothetical protein
MFSLRHDFPNEWQTLHGSGRAATFTIAKDRQFPTLVQPGAITVAEAHAALILKEARPSTTYKATLTAGASAPIDLLWPGSTGRYRSVAKDVTIPISASPANNAWKLQITAPTLLPDIDAIKDILIAVRYSVKM